VLHVVVLADTVQTVPRISQPIRIKVSLGDEIANMNFYDDISSTTIMQCAPEATEFSEITQNKGHHGVQGHSRSPILVPIESSLMTSY